MSSKKYNAFLSSACFSVMAVSLCNLAPAYAGFEWIPPKETVEALPLPVQTDTVLESTTLETVAPELLLESDAQKFGVGNEASLEDVPEGVLATETEADKDNESSSAEDIVEKTSKEKMEVTEKVEILAPEVFEKTIQKAETNIDSDMNTEAYIDTNNSATTSTVDNLGTEEEDASSQESESLTINPFPMEEEARNITKIENTIVLPPDSDKNISDLTAEEVGLKDNSNINTPKENIIWNVKESFYVIDGFGREIPLALALRQIVPPQYAFSFGKGINPGALVSWDGGKPWNEVLEGAISPLNIRYELKDKKLLLNKISSGDKSNVDVRPEIEIEETVEEGVPSDNAEKKYDETVSDEMLEESIDIDQSSEGKLINIQHKQEKEVFDTKENATSEKDVTEQDDMLQSDIIETKETAEMEEIEESNKEAVKESAKSNFVVEDTSVKSVLDNETVENIPQRPVIEIVENNDIVEEKEIRPAPPQPEEGIVHESEQEPSVIKRNIVSDPGYFESEQPEVSEKDKLGVIGISAEEFATNDINISDNLQDGEIETTVIEEITARPPTVSAPEEGEIFSFRKKPSDEIRIWEASRGRDLEQILEEWSKEENVKFVWNLSENYKIDKDIYVSGTFKNAVSILFSKGVKNAPKYILLEDATYELSVTSR